MFKIKLLISMLFLKSLFLDCNSEGKYRSFGPEFKATTGEVWPKPYWQDDTGDYYAIDPNNFQLTAVNRKCDILQAAIKRYTAIIVKSAAGYNRAPITATKGNILQIRVNLTQPCETLPHLNMDESCNGDYLVTHPSCCH